MSAESELKRYRDQAVKLQEEVSRYSKTVATKRRKAADANSGALRSKSDSTIRLKLREAETATKDANTAESKRASSEKKLATAGKKIAELQAKYEREQRTQTEQSLAAIRRASATANSQFLGAPIIPMTLSSASIASSVNDVFLSHASEDKDEIARPLREALEVRGATVWFDELKIKVGQSIRQEIEKGIAGARFGVVILSPSFFEKQWTQAELDGLFSKKMDTGRSLMLPVWHRVTKDEVASHSPLLAGLLALNTAVMTIDEIADAIAEAVQDKAV